jgi:small GTP-binding protein
MEEKPNDDFIKIILLGESGVGKTNLINVSQGKDFDANSASSFSSSYLYGQLNHLEKEYKYVLWDTVGQETYRSLNQLFMKNSKVIIFVYAMDNAKSYNELDYWIKTANESNNEDCIMAIVGNKCDLIDKQVVSDNEAETYAEEKGMKIKFTSAKKDPLGFKNFLEELIKDYINEYILHNIDANKKNKDNKIVLNNNSNKKKKKCCK